MTMSTRSGAGGGQRSPQGGLAEVLDLILDKGLVIDVFAKVSLVGIEIVTIDARIVVASVDTYLRFAEATNRLDLHASTCTRKAARASASSSAEQPAKPPKVRPGGPRRPRPAARSKPVR